jgi:dihydropyrimidinase
MVSTIIKNGTIVTADLTYKADVRVANGGIIGIGQGLARGHDVFPHACPKVAEVVQ